MKDVCLVVCGLAVVLVGAVATAGDVDAHSLRNKIAEQNARLNGLQAKVNSGNADADSGKSLLVPDKNASVTIGGTVNSRYPQHSGTIKSHGG